MNDSNPVALGYEIYKQLTNPWAPQFVSCDSESQSKIAPKTVQKKII